MFVMKPSVKEQPPEYLSRTFDDLLNELMYHVPHLIRAIQLIPLMYNRLTLVDNWTHKDAMNKMREVFKEIKKRFPDERGLSDRNLYRYLPSENPNVPHRTKRSEKPAESRNTKVVIVTIDGHVDPREPDVIRVARKRVVPKDGADSLEERYAVLAMELMNGNLEIAFRRGRAFADYKRVLPKLGEMTYKEFNAHRDEIHKEFQLRSVRI